VSFDAVVAGGSFAGACAAAALQRLGMRVLVCEPGLADSRRLAGELIQAPGAHALGELGLLGAAWDAGAVPACGFAVLPESGGDPIILSYGETAGCHSTGVALEHSALAAAMLRRVATLPGVTVRRVRVTQASGFDGPSVRVETSDGRHLDAALLVAADGRGSKLREAAGIGADLGEKVRMAGAVVKGPLPHEGYGHVVLSGRAPVLAYRIGPSAVRVLFTRTAGDGTPFADDVRALPAPLAAQVASAVTAGELASTIVYALTPHRSSNGRLFLAGDSGGCVHPVTATGVSFCATDALRLERALRGSRGDVHAASLSYTAERAAPLRTRVALGPLLAETLGGGAPEAQALRRGLVRYWRHDRGGRGASMGLLSTHEPRFGVLAREYVKVLGHALAGAALEPAPVVERLGVCAKLVGGTGRLAARAWVASKRPARPLPLTGP